MQKKVLSVNRQCLLLVIFKLVIGRLYKGKLAKDRLSKDKKMIMQ